MPSAATRSAERAHVGAHARGEVGVGDGGAQPLVLAELGMHLVRRHDGQRGEARAGALQHLPLVVGGEEGVEKADGQGLDGLAGGRLGGDPRQHPLDLLRGRAGSARVRPP